MAFTRRARFNSIMEPIRNATISKCLILSILSSMLDNLSNFGMFEKANIVSFSCLYKSALHISSVAYKFCRLSVVNYLHLVLNIFNKFKNRIKLDIKRRSEP